MEVTTESLLRMTSNCFEFCHEKTRHLIHDSNVKAKQLQNSIRLQAERRACEERDKCVAACEAMQHRCPHPDKLAVFHHEQEMFERKAASRPAAVSTTGGVKTDGAGGWRGIPFFGGTGKRGEEKSSRSSFKKDFNGATSEGVTWSLVDRCEVLAEEMVKVIFTLATKPTKIEITMPEGVNPVGSDGGLQNRMIGSGGMGMTKTIEDNIDSGLSLDQQMKKLRELETESGGEGGPLFHGMMSPKGHESAKKFAQMGEGSIDQDTGAISFVPQGNKNFSTQMMKVGNEAVSSGEVPSSADMSRLAATPAASKGAIMPVGGSVPFDMPLEKKEGGDQGDAERAKRVAENPHYHPAAKKHLMTKAQLDAEAQRRHKEPSSELSPAVRNVLLQQQQEEADATRIQKQKQLQQQQQRMAATKKTTTAEVDEALSEFQLPTDQMKDEELRTGVGRMIEQQKQNVSNDDYLKVNELINYSQRQGLFSDDPNRKMMKEMKEKLEQHSHLLTREKAAKLEELRTTDPERYKLWKDQMDLEVELSTMGVQRSGVNW